MFLLAVIMLSGGISVLDTLYAQTVRKKQTTQADEFKRPKPTQPIKPTVPDANRYQKNKVFLEKADSLFRPDPTGEEKQVVKGGVVFRQGGMWMMCDSAYFFPERNSLNAFGHVEMKQGDTLFVYADHLFYNGFDRKAYLASGPSRKNVTLKNRKVTLVTDSLDYDLNIELGWYSTGGKLTDDMNTLTSIYGEYSPATKLARFMQDVEMVNRKDGFKMFTEELDYNTATHIASISTQTRIEGANDTILTSSGTYNTVTDNAVLTSRSTLIHKDSANNVVTLEGDSLIYDKARRLSRAYMFRDHYKNGRPMVLTDTAHRVVLYGGFGEYNDSTQRALATEYPLLIEYSRTDTLFLRADTILTQVRVEPVWPDSLAHSWDAATRLRLSRFHSLQEVGEDMRVELPLLPYGFGRTTYLPTLRGSGLPKATTGRPAKSAPAPASRAPLPSNQEAGVKKPEEVSEQALSQDPSDPSKPSVGPGPEQNPPLKRIDGLGRDSAMMVMKDFYDARAIGRARFFKQDLQGIADTINYQQFDSMLYLIRKPVVWSGERQLYGGRINIHLVDSTADWAELPLSGFMAEHIEDEFYNQLAGKKMTAFFRNKQLDRLIVNGSVEAIFLPLEKDSTYNRLLQAESSYLTMEMGDRSLDRLKMWPEVTGSLTPIFLVKQKQLYLPGFKWFEALRPRREWYGDRLRWIDNLGEVPEDLEKYFKSE